MLPLGSPLGLPSRLPYKYGFKAVLGLLVWLLVMLGGGRWDPSTAGGGAGLGMTSQAFLRAGMLVCCSLSQRAFPPAEHSLNAVTTAW